MLNMKFRKGFIVFAAIAGIIACVADVALTFHYGRAFPAYNSFRQPMSILGSDTSPFATPISNWWMMQGILLILFAMGFISSYAHAGKIVIWAGILIIIYGLGEGVATGAIPVQVRNGHLTLQGYIHDGLGGIGVAAVMISPFLMRKYFIGISQNGLARLSLILGILGIFFFAMFSIAKIYETNHGIFAYGGAWQRLSSINYYLYFITLAILMMRKIFTFNSKLSDLN
jgi:hypothetical protein